jgi:hypothetical protein
MVAKIPQRLAAQDAFLCGWRTRLFAMPDNLAPTIEADNRLAAPPVQHETQPLAPLLDFGGPRHFSDAPNV